MSIPLRVKRSDVFGEFTEYEQNSYFDLKDKKYLADLDNFYFNLYLDEETCKEEIEYFIKKLDKLKEAFDIKSENKIDFYDFDFYPFRYKCYDYRLQVPECFDVLIAKTLPNEATPRIQIQLRSRFLWIDGCKKCIKNSYEKVASMLGEFNINVMRVMENRVDYAYHNNLIQNPEKFFDRPKLKKHCKTNARIYNLVGNPQNDFSLDYCSLGSRSSKSVFFRVYNKTREVVEMNYKSFFIEKWYKEGLISYYDKWVLDYAFMLKSYDVGVLIGQIQFYIQFGKDKNRKKELEELVKKYYADNINSAKIRRNVKKQTEKTVTYKKKNKAENPISDENISYIRKSISNILPPVTVITNIEFETHRDFYRSFDKSLEALRTDYDDILARVYQIYGCRKSFVNYLTSYGNTVAFVKDNKVSKKEFSDDMYLDFWKRLRGTNLNTKYQPDLLRAYERQADVKKALRKVCSDIAVLSIHKNGLNDNFDVLEDFSDALSLLNDNDMRTVFVDEESGEQIKSVKYGDFYTVKQRKNRQYRGIIPKKDSSATEE